MRNLGPIKLNFIQILRGFAAMAVLMFHLDGDTLRHFNHSFFNFKYGYLGVDFFFALSGFIITYIHLKDIERRGGIKRFLTKRVIRIFPLYWLALIVAVVQQAPDFVDKPELTSLFTPFNLQGWTVILKNIFLLPLPIGQMPVGVAWTLTYELVFYAVFAVCIFSGWKFSRYIVALWLLFILLNSRDLFPKTHWTEAIGGNLIVEFLAGCAIGYLFVKGKELSAKWLLAGLFVITGLFTAYLFKREFNRYSIAMTSLMGAASALIIFYAATADKNGRYARLALPALVLIGDASYSIYLTHSLYTSYICDLFNKMFNVTVLSNVALDAIICIVFLVSISIGVIIHLLIEKPMLNYLHDKFNLKRKKRIAPV